MYVYLAELRPALASTGAEQVLRYSSQPSWTRADGVDWLPMLAVPFRRNTQIFDGAFQSQPQDYGALEFAVSRGQSITPLTAMVWDGRPVKIWKGLKGQNTAAMTLVFDGTADSVSGKRSRVTVKLKGPNVNLPLLPTVYAGTGGAEGPTDLKNTPKPMLLGSAMNLEPIYVNRALGIFQYHAYGAAGGVSAVYDSGSQLGTSIGDYASYALLAAATIPAGRYATCNAAGLARHGGDITGVLTIDAVGAVSSGLPGAVIKWILRTHLGLAAAKVKEDSLDWLDTQLPHPQDIYVTEQIDSEEFCRQLMLSLGGYIWWTETGMFTVGLIRRGGASAAAVNRLNIQDTPQLRETSPPVWKRSQGYQRSWRVHSYSEVRTPKELNPRGTWSSSPSPVYQYYDLVDWANASWVYVSSTAGSTATPGTDAAVWQYFRSNGAAVVESSTTPADPQPGLLWRNPTNGQLKSYIGGTWVLVSDVTSQNTAAAITGQGTLATANAVAYATQITSLPTAIQPGNLLTGGLIDAGQARYGPGGPLVQSLQPSQAGADVTATHTAAAITGQSAWATYGTFTPNAVTNPGANLIYDAGLSLQGQTWSLAGWSWGYGADVGYYAAAPGSSVNMQIGARMSVYGGNSYTFSLYSGGTGYSGGGTMQLNWYDSGDNYLGQTVGAGTGQNVGYGRTQITASLPANAAYVRCFMQAPASLTGFFIVYRPKLELGGSPTVWSNETTYGARYQGGVTIDALKPAEVNANVTETRTAAAITGQAAWATYNGVTPTTMNVRTSRLLDADGTYDDIGTIRNRRITRLQRLDGVTDITEGLVITPLGTAAAIAGQGALATQNSVRVSQMLSKAPSYCPDPQFTDEAFWAPDPNGWYYQISNPAQTGTGGKGAALWSGNPNDTTGTTRKHIWSAYIECPVPIGTQLMISAHHWNSSNQYSYAEVKFRDTNNNDVGSITCQCPGWSSGVFNAVGTVPSTTRYIQFVIYNQSGTTFSGAIQVTGIRLVDVSQYSDGVLIDALRPAELNANVTESRTAAAIAGQGALATRNNVGSAQMTASFGTNLLPCCNPAWVPPASFFITGWNPDNITGIDAYRSAQNGGFGYEWSLDPANCSWAIYQGNASTGAVGISDYYFRWLVDQNSGSNYVQEVPVVAGQTVEFSVYTGNHHCTPCSVGFVFTNAAGTSLGEGDNRQGNSNDWTEAKNGGNTLDNYKRVYVRATAPAGATKVSPYVRKGHTAQGQGFTDSWLFLVNPMLTIVPSGQNELTPWAPPGNFGSSVYFNGSSINALRPAEFGANVTGTNTAAALAGQGAFATMSQLDPRTSYFRATGSIPATVPDNSFTYTSDTNSITVSWPAITIYRVDGTTVSVGSGSQAITGLATATTYKLYPYISDSGGTSGSISFVGGSSGSPSIAWPSSGSAAAAAAMYGRSNIPLGSFLAATTASGSGGGGGGGSNCLHPSTLVPTSRGLTPASTLDDTDEILTPDGYRRVTSIEGRLGSDWIAVATGQGEVATVTRTHVFYRANGKHVRAEELLLGDLLRTDGDHVEVTGLRIVREKAMVVMIEMPDPHLYYAGQAHLLSHNIYAKP